MTSTQLPPFPDGATQVLPGARPQYGPPRQAGFGGWSQPAPYYPQPSYPPAWGPQPGLPPQPQRPNNTKKWLALAGVAAVALTAVGVTWAVVGTGSDDADDTTASSTTQSEDAADTAEDAEPPAETLVSDPGAVLLSRSALNKLVGDQLTLDGEHSEFIDSSDRISRTECVSAWSPFEQESYRDSGYDDAALQAHTADADLHMVVQAAVTFPSAADAEAYVSTTKSDWQLCADTTIIVESNDGDVLPWRTGNVKAAGGALITLAHEPVGTTSFSCERALGAQGNVVIDVMSCAGDPTGEAADIAEAISENVGIEAT